MNKKLSICLKSFLLVCSVSLFACSQPQAPSEQHSSEKTTISDIESGTDYHSFSNPDEIKVTHIDLDLYADFNQKSLIGSATLSFDRVNPHATTLIVDTRDLTITRVNIDGNPIAFKLMAKDENLGAPLY